VTALLKVLVLPPLSLFLLAALGLLVARRRRKLGLFITGGAACLLVLLTIPFVSAGLLISLQTAPALPPEGPYPDAQAIVVLGADVNPRAPEYGGATVGSLSMERLRYAARLARATGLPLLTTGGSLMEGTPAVAELMARVLEDELATPVRWTEIGSRTTRQNADFTAGMLAGEGVRRVFLVTHAWHMPRARAAFESAGLEVVPAPTGFRIWPDLVPRSFLPSARSMRQSYFAFHEWIGRLWYALS